MELKNNYILLAIDPSLKQTGWSVLKVLNDCEECNLDNKKIELLDYGIIPTHALKHGNALMYFEKVITDIIEKYKPDYVTAEQMFSGNNRQTGMKLANIHGVMQLVCAKSHLDIVYYSVMTAKSVVCGGIKTKKEDGTKKTGEEMKIEIAENIFNILGKNSFNKEYTLDVTDAISIGITFIKLNGEGIKKKVTGKKKKL